MAPHTNKVTLPGSGTLATRNLLTPLSLVGAMRGVHANSKGEKGVIVQLGDSITYSMAYFAPLQYTAEAKRGSYPCDFERVFQEVFPSVLKFVRRINRRDHAELIRTLQRLESLLVIEHVAPRLVGEIPFTPLHDAIYSRKRDTGCVVIETDDGILYLASGHHRYAANRQASQKLVECIVRKGSRCSCGSDWIADGEGGR